MILPSLFVRQASFSDRIARWDGAVQRLQLKAQGLNARSLSEMPLEGVAPALSLHVAVFDAEGAKLHDGLGGLEVLVRVRAIGTSLSGEPGFRFTARTDLGTSPERVIDGIATAFEPFLPRMPD